MAFLNILGIWCFITIAIVSSWPIVLDKESDVKGIMWKVKSYSFYLANEKALNGTFHQYLPDDFAYNNFAFSEGIWTVVPNMMGKDKDCEPDLFKMPDWFKDSDEKDSDECNTTTVGIFHFKAAAQLVSSVKVKYTFGGNATIRISGASGGPFEESANGKRHDEWIETEVPLDGRLMNLDAIAYTKGDYVLIDKITVEIMQASTTPRTTTPRTGTPRTTTRRTTTRRTTTRRTTTPWVTTPSTTTSEETETTTSTTPADNPIPASGQESVMTTASFVVFFLFATFSASLIQTR